MARSLPQDLIQLRKLKRSAEDIGRKKKAADAEFKKHQGRVIHRISALTDGMEESEFSMKFGGTLFSLVQKLKGQIEDRGPYVRWCLENDEGIQEFLAKWAPRLRQINWAEEFEADFYDAITSTTMVTYKEIGDVMNRQARAHVDDGQPLPPGLTFRPDDYISQRAS